MKWTVSLWRTAKWGRRQKAFIGQRIKNKEEEHRKYLVGWGNTVHFVWGEETQSWLGIWELANYF